MYIFSIELSKDGVIYRSCNSQKCVSGSVRVYVYVDLRELVHRMSKCSRRVMLSGFGFIKRTRAVIRVTVVSRLQSTMGYECSRNGLIIFFGLTSAT